MKLSSTKLKVFGGWIVVLMCIMAFSSKVLGSESIPKERENYQFTERSVPLKSGKAHPVLPRSLDSTSFLLEPTLFHNAHISSPYPIFAHRSSGMLS